MNDEPVYTKAQLAELVLCGMAIDMNDLGDDPEIVAKIADCEEDMELVKTIAGAIERLYDKYFDANFETKDDDDDE